MVVSDLRDKVRAAGDEWAEAAILYRTNNQSQALEDALRRKGIPYRIYKGNSFYDHKEIRDMMAYIRLVINPRDDEAFKRIVNYPARGIGDTTVQRIAALAAERGVSMWEAVDALVAEPVTDPVQRTIARKVADFVAMIRGLSLGEIEFSDLFRVIWKEIRVAVFCGATLAAANFAKLMLVDKMIFGNPITITDPNMTRFLMNLDEAVDLVMFAFQHANPGDLFIQKSDASTIGDLAKAVQQLFGDTGTNIIGTRHGEKLFETLMTREERLRSEDMGGYYRVAADNRDLNYDKFVVKGEVHTMADDSYTSHNTNRLDVEGTVKKILTTEYVQNALKEMEAEKKA